MWCDYGVFLGILQGFAALRDEVVLHVYKLRKASVYICLVDLLTKEKFGELRPFSCLIFCMVVHSYGGYIGGYGRRLY